MMEIDITINGEPIRTISCVNTGEKEDHEDEFGQYTLTRYDTVFKNVEDGTEHELEVWHERDDGAMSLASSAIYTVFNDVILNPEVEEE